VRSVVHASPALAAIPVALLAACADVRDGGADLVVQDTAIVLETSAPFARSGDFPQRLESTITAALRYWGGDWRHLAGATITLAEGPWVLCGGAPALGCWDGDIRVATADPGAGTFACVEQTVLVHEVGHAVIGDPDHRDPRWMDLAPLEQELRGRLGYRDAGAVACDIAVSVWRHPPRG
jgi:hypothetical protein